MTLAESRPISRAQLADQYATFKLNLDRPFKLAWAKSLWEAFAAEGGKIGDSPHDFFKGITDALAVRGITKTPASLYPYWFCGYSVAEEYAPRTVKEGDSIGRAIKAGLSREQIASHVLAGTLDRELAAGRPVVKDMKVLAGAKEVLEAVPEAVRRAQIVTGLSDVELRALPVLGYNALPPQFQELILRVGLGESLPPLFVFKPDERNPDTPGDLLSPPLDYGAFLKRFMPCWVTGRYPDPHSVNDLHHVRVGEVEARPGDDTPDVLVPVRRQAHIPLPCVEGSGAAHSRAFVIGQDAVRNQSLNRWQACAVRAYSEFVRGGDWKAWAEKANQERLAA